MDLVAHHFREPLEEPSVCRGFFVSHGRGVLGDTRPPNDLPGHRQRFITVSTNTDPGCSLPVKFRPTDPEPVALPILDHAGGSYECSRNHDQG